MSDSASPPPETPVVFDTVVVNYFLAAGEVELLTQLFGQPLRVPRAVFDPDEEDSEREEAMSELRRGLHLHRRRVADKATAPELRDKSIRALPHFERLPGLFESVTIAVLDMDAAELRRYAEMRDPKLAATFGTVLGLGAGEAAMLAICENRKWVPATDDSDAITVAKRLLPGVRPLRIRAILRRAIDAGLIDLGAGRRLHQTMRELGFWDTGQL
ncbi:MAG TPA: hypothetical protein VNL94_01680 [Candidatus Binatia bacterium]|nr:hypothetical protein [Candidatus Binatia bacterium]